MKMKEISQGRSEIYKIDPRIIELDESYNVRVSLNGIDELAQSIKENGVKVPMSVRIDGDRVLLVRGHRRFAAVQKLIEEGIEILNVPCTSERMGEEDRVLDLIISNDGEKLNPLEMGEVFQRLVNFGWNQVKIAQRAGTTQANVSSCLKLVSAPVKAKQAIIDGIMASSLVLSIVNESKTEKEINEKIDKAYEVSEQNSTNGAKKKVTKRSIAEKQNISFDEVTLVIDALEEMDISDEAKGIVADKLRQLKKVCQETENA
jgi:ParB family chromosome partitioning protein